jgi:hypothetical protein
MIQNQKADAGIVRSDVVCGAATRPEDKCAPVPGQCQSHLDHLILSIFPGNGDGGQMAFVTVHYDDSGTHPESSIALAACWVSTVDQWKDFERNWEELKQDEGFDTFHMTDFAAGEKKFAGWSDDKKRRVLRRVCTIINTRVRVGYVASVTKKDYDEIITGRFRSYAGKYHYSFAVRTCAGFVAGWRKKYEQKSSMKYVFDQMGKGKGEIMAVLDAAIKQSKRESAVTGVPPLTGYGFEDKKLICPLQASDVAAWTSFQMFQHYVANRLPTKTHWIAELAFDLLRPKLNAVYFKRDKLAAWARAEEDAWTNRIVERARSAAHEIKTQNV